MKGTSSNIYETRPSRVLSLHGGVWGSAPAAMSAFLFSEQNGRWGAAEPVPGLVSLAGPGMGSAVSSVSCASPGNCALAGTFQQRVWFTSTIQDQHSLSSVYVASEARGRWSAAIPVPGLQALHHGGSADVTPVSCAGAGSCAAGGWYVSFQGRQHQQQAWVATETDGHWHAAQTVAGVLNVGRYAKVETVSCVYAPKRAPYSGGTVNAFLVRSRDGVGGQADPVPGVAAASGGSELTSASCVPAWCAAVGTYIGCKGPQLFVVNLP